MERDRCWGNIDFGIKISTHTLTWSVTIPKAQFTEFMVISTHTLTWSVTPFVGVSKQKSSISTHTLTWSVTTCSCLLGASEEDFNSHAHVERDT